MSKTIRDLYFPILFFETSIHTGIGDEFKRYIKQNKLYTV